MICPNCRRDMIVVEYHRIELDYCTGCEGVWFDAGEIELFLQCVKLASPEAVMENMLNLPEVKPSGKQRKCPICNLGMRETAVGEPAILADVCRRGDGLWFDGGEVHELLRQMANKPATKASSEQQIFSFLGDVFKFPERGYLSLRKRVQFQ